MDVPSLSLIFIVSSFNSFPIFPSLHPSLPPSLLLSLLPLFTAPPHSPRLPFSSFPPHLSSLSVSVPGACWQYNKCSPVTKCGVQLCRECCPYHCISVPVGNAVDFFCLHCLKFNWMSTNMWRQETGREGYALLSSNLRKNKNKGNCPYQYQQRIERSTQWRE